MKTAEEIIKKQGHIYVDDDVRACYTITDCITAMQEYADQQSDYWKRRCQAAEFLYHLSQGLSPEISDDAWFKTIKEWKSLVNQKSRP